LVESASLSAREDLVSHIARESGGKDEDYRTAAMLVDHIDELIIARVRDALSALDDSSG
jgi:hypothetical protein